MNSASCLRVSYVPGMWAPNMVKSMQLLEAVLNEQPRATVMDPRAGIVPTCPRLIAVVLLKGDSGRTYRLSIRDMDGTGLHCSFNIEGARWRTDLLSPYVTGAPVASFACNPPNTSCRPVTVRSVLSCPCFVTVRPPCASPCWGNSSLPIVRCSRTSGCSPTKAPCLILMSLMSSILMNGARGLRVSRRGRT